MAELVPQRLDDPFVVDRRLDVCSLMRAFHESMKDVDVYVTIPYAGSTVYMTNSTGHPTLITRCGMLDGRPLMMEFLAQPFREDAALRVALAYERATEWHKTWPNVGA